MKKPSPDSEARNPEDRDFARHLAEHYAPEPLSPTERVRFDEALRERLARPRRARLLTPALAAAAAAVLIWLVLPAGNGSSGEDGTQLASVWEYELLLSSDLSGSAEEHGEGLPDDYLAIASVFLDEL